jgi:hypothetical protein
MRFIWNKGGVVILERSAKFQKSSLKFGSERVESSIDETRSAAWPIDVFHVAILLYRSSFVRKQYSSGFIRLVYVFNTLANSERTALFHRILIIRVTFCWTVASRCERFETSNKLVKQVQYIALD